MGMDYATRLERIEGLLQRLVDSAEQQGKPKDTALDQAAEEFHTKPQRIVEPQSIPGFDWM